MFDPCQQSTESVLTDETQQTLACPVKTKYDAITLNKIIIKHKYYQDFYYYNLYNNPKQCITIIITAISQ